MTWFRKWMILTHRWLGIALSLLLTVWFVSGIAMIYAGGMPDLTPERRLQKLPALNLSAIRLTPAEAAQKASFDQSPALATLLTIMDRPAYRFILNDLVIVFADTGEVLAGVNTSQALKIASRFMSLPEDQLHHAGVLLQADQWTIGKRGQMPLHKIVVDDSAHTQLYVSEFLGEVVLETTRSSRALAWMAAIPHWLYFAPLRLNDGLWRQVILWTSGIGTVLVLLGIIVGVIQFSRSRPHIPYAGWMRWHYITGAIFGVFALTWVFSGMLSMEPWFWASSGGTGDGIPFALSGGPLDVSVFPPMEAETWKRILEGRLVKEVEFMRIQDEPYYSVQGDSAQPVLVSAKSLQVRREAFSIESIMSRVQAGNPDIHAVESQLLSDYDSYYYSRDSKAPLPVMRVKFADPDSTWMYIDAGMSQVRARFTRRQRLQRWIYTGLHDLDFSFWYYNRPFWDIGVIVLSLGGAVLSGIGLYIGIKRVIRNVNRGLRRLRGSSSQSSLARPSV